MAASITLPLFLAAADSVPAHPLVSGLGLFGLCLLAAAGTFLLLPGPWEPAIRKIGAAVLAAAGLILTGLLHQAEISVSQTGPAPAAGGIYFWIFSALALIGAVRVITHPRPVYSALYFILTVFASAGLFVLLWAQFIAAALVLIYAGAILVTYVFVIMLAAQADGPAGQPLAGLADYDTRSRDPFIAAFFGFVLLAVVLSLVLNQTRNLTPIAPIEVPRAQASLNSTQRLGLVLYQDQLIPVELAGLILTIAMVGAVVIARRRVPAGQGEFEPTAEQVNAIATPINDDPHSIPVTGTDNPRQKEYPEH
jgi:NADH-quinone oxidoreductase subunit J